MRAVLRLTVNERVSLLDSAGVEHRGVIDRYERDRAVIRIESSLPVNPCPTSNHIGRSNHQRPANGFPR